LLAGLARGRLSSGVHQTGSFLLEIARVFDGVHRFFAVEKTIDGERFLKRIHVRIGVGCSFVGN
jgi:hypothetical protein